MATNDELRAAALVLIEHCSENMPEGYIISLNVSAVAHSVSLWCDADGGTTIEHDGGFGAAVDAAKTDAKRRGGDG